MDPGSIERAAERARRAHAWRFCVVLSSRGPNAREMDTVCEAVENIKRIMKVNICASMGMLTLEEAKRLKESGVDRINHNIESSRRYFRKITTTHTFEDRLETIRRAQTAGLGICCGGIVGMGEEDEDVVDMAFTLRELDVDSIPVNFFNPVTGTPIEGPSDLTPARCLKILSLFRFCNPRKDIRAAGGREVHLRDMQPTALRVANSMFTEGYLTTPGNTARQDLAMIREAGLEIVEP
jgi:biotin synthase